MTKNWEQEMSLYLTHYICKNFLKRFNLLLWRALGEVLRMRKQHRGRKRKKEKKTIDKIEKNKITLKVIKCDQEGKSRSFLGKA